MTPKTFCAALLLLAAPAFAGQWSENFEGATAQAKQDNKYVLVDFTGSDWCGWCKKLDREVFSQKEFQDYAAANLVCVTIDFPRGKPQSAQQRASNSELQDKFGVTGYPTIFVLSPTGEIVARTGYRAGGAQPYVDHLKQFIDSHQKAGKAP